MIRTAGEISALLVHTQEEEEGTHPLSISTYAMKHFLLPSLLSTLFLTACNQPAVPPELSGTDTVSVAASFYPLAFLAEKIGGARITVSQVTPAGIEPHDYEPSPKQIAAVYDADVFLFNGAGVDSWAETIHQERTAASSISIEIAEHLTLLEGGDSHHHDDEEGGEHDENQHNQEEHAEDHSEHEGYDPHFWLSPVRMKDAAVLVRDALIEADPQNADAYRTQTEQLLQELTLLDTNFQNGLAECRQDFVVVSHNAFRYLADQYHFETLAIAGMSAAEEPSAKRMAELADLAEERDIAYIFFETLVSPKLAETLAEEIGAEPLVLNPIEGLTLEDEQRGIDYLSLMQENLQNLRTAMQCQ